MLGIKDRKYFRTTILQGLLDSGALKMTLPNKPRSINQKYVTREDNQ